MKRVSTYVDDAHNEVPMAKATFLHEATYDGAGRLVSDVWRQLKGAGLPSSPVLKPLPLTKKPIHPKP